MYGKGISRTGEVLDLAVDLGIAKKGGAWFSYNDMKLGQGRDNAKEFLATHPDIMAEFEEQIKQKIAEKKAEEEAELAKKKAAAAGRPAGGSESAKSKLEEKAEAAAAKKKAAKELSIDDVSAEDNFEEFAPVDISSLGN